MIAASVAFTNAFKLPSTTRKLFMMSDKLLPVPKINPMKPMMMSNTLRHTTTLSRPNLSGQSTQISIIAGKVMPNIDRHIAPTSEMNKARRGTVIASTTNDGTVEKSEQSNLKWIRFRGLFGETDCTVAAMLTCDHDNCNSSDEFPLQFSAKPLRQIIRPNNFHRHVALQAIRDERGNREYGLNHFRGAENWKKNTNYTFERIGRCSPTENQCLHVALGQIERDALVRLRSISKIFSFIFQLIGYWIMRNNLSVRR